MVNHARLALREQFPLSVDTPLPQDTKEDAVFPRDSTPEQLRSFWEQQLRKLEKLAQDSKLAQKKRGAAIPDGVKPADGKLKTVAISQLMRQCGLQGQSWVHQFALGFPITGELSQRFTYERDGKYVDLFSRSTLFGSDPARFKEREAKSGR